MRTWEGEVFLYNPLTTHTHILNELGWYGRGAVGFKNNLRLEKATGETRSLHAHSKIIEVPLRIEFHPRI